MQIGACLLFPEPAQGHVPVEVAFCADSEGNGQDWQAKSFRVAVVDGESSYSFRNRRMEPVVLKARVA